MRQKFIRKIRIMVSAAAAAALICGCTAGQAGSVKTTEAPREETGPAAATEMAREETGLAAMDSVLPDRIGVNTDGDYPYDAEEIMYLSGVRFTAYRENTRYSLCDLDGDGFVGPGDFALFNINWLKDSDFVYPVV